jgi:cytoskeleton protein RodZ
MENVLSDDSAQDLEFRFQTVGEKLKAGREAKGLSLNDIALRTRIPLRHLEAIERSEYSALPGTTYTVGFAKSYARAMDMNDGEIATELRAELTQSGYEIHTTPTPSYEPADGARVPSARLAWIAAGLAVVLLAGYFIWRSFALTPSASVAAEEDKPVLKESAETKTADAPAAAVDPKGQVTLTATDTVWLRIYDGNKKRLFEKEMTAGEKYDVPTDAINPMINTGRPQSISVTIGGKPVATLGPPERAISDVGVSAAALLARNAPPAAATTTSATPRPATGVVPTTAPAKSGR